MNRLNFKTTQGILEEVENAANDYMVSRNIQDAAARLKSCDIAIKIHALEHMKDRFQTMKLKYENKVQSIEME